MATKKTVASAKSIDQDMDFLGTTVDAFKKAFTNHVHHTLARDNFTVTDHEKFLAIAYAVRDRLIDRWIKTQQTYYDKDVKRVSSSTGTAVISFPTPMCLSLRYSPM